MRMTIYEMRMRRFDTPSSLFLLIRVESSKCYRLLNPPPWR